MNKNKLKFRANTVEGMWIYGMPVYSDDEIEYMNVIGYVPGRYDTFRIKPETICQFTGLTDSNGKEIYDGDILRKKDGLHYLLEIDKDFLRTAIYCLQQGKIDGICTTDKKWYGEIKREGVEVAGNIYDNPELLHIYD